MAKPKGNHSAGSATIAPPTNIGTGSGKGTVIPKGQVLPQTNY